MVRHLPAGLVLLMGAPGSGKTTLAEQFAATGQIDPAGVVNPDAIRAELNGDAADQANAAEVFARRDRAVLARLRAGSTVVVDGTNLHAPSRRRLIDAARQRSLPVSVVRLATDLATCQARNASRERQVPTSVVADFHRRAEMVTTADLLAEGVDTVVELAPGDPYPVILPGADRATAHHVRGPFDILGDVHGHLDAFTRLVTELGYSPELEHPDGRLLVLVGDVVDKGPEPLAMLRHVMALHRRGRLLMVRGNHEAKLARVLVKAMRQANGSTGRLVSALGSETAKAKEGLARTLEQLRCAEDFESLAAKVVRFVGQLPLQVVLDAGRLVVVHASIREDLIGVDPTVLSAKEHRDLEQACLYGPPLRGATPGTLDFADHYSGEALVVRGHLSVTEPRVRNRVVSVDTGAGDAQRLSAYAYPEGAFTTVDCLPV